MSDRTEALRHAGKLDAHEFDEPHGAAAELRRLQINIDALGLHLSERMKDLARVEAQRDALLEALRPFAAINASIGFTYKDVDRARAAIKAVEEGK